VPDRKELQDRLNHLSRRMAAAQNTRLTRARRELERLRSNRMLQDMRAPIDDRRMLLDSMQRHMAAALEQRTKSGRVNLAKLSAGLHAMSPLKVLGRGYAIAKGESGVVSSVSQTSPGEQIDLMLADGVLHCQVNEKEERTWQ
jgi:exodeoxyribonuclease VII large subunit